MAILIKQQLNFLDKSDMDDAHIDQRRLKTQLRFYDLDVSADSLTRSSRTRKCKDSMSMEERGLIRNLRYASPLFFSNHTLLLSRNSLRL